MSSPRDDQQQQQSPIETPSLGRPDSNDPFDGLQATYRDIPFDDVGEAPGLMAAPEPFAALPYRDEDVYRSLDTQQAHDSFGPAQGDFWDSALPPMPEPSALSAKFSQASLYDKQPHATAGGDAGTQHTAADPYAFGQATASNNKLDFPQPIPPFRSTTSDHIKDLPEIPEAFQVKPFQPTSTSTSSLPLPPPPPPAQLQRSATDLSSAKTPAFAAPVFKTKLSSDCVDEAVGEPPCPPGNHLEACYHFFSDTAAKSLLEHVRCSLGSLGCDVQVRAPKFKLKCTAYSPQGVRCPFVVRVFTNQAKHQGAAGAAQGARVGAAGTGSYAVEFQRRAGDIMYFSQLYQLAMDKIGKLCVLFTSPNVSAGLCALPPPPQAVGRSVSAPPVVTRSPVDLDLCVNRLPKDCVEVTPQEVHETLGCLIKMCRSKCTDVRVRAFESIMGLSSTDAYRQHMCHESGVCDALMAAIKSPVEDMQSCAVTAVANLTRLHQKLGQKLCEREGIPALISAAKSTTRHVMRESSRALANLAEGLGSHCKTTTKQLRLALVHVRKCKDPECDKNAERLGRCVQPESAPVPQHHARMGTPAPATTLT